MTDPSTASRSVEWPTIPTEIHAPVEFIVAHLDQVRGAAKKTTEWEQALPERIHALVDELLVHESGGALTPSVAEALRTDPEARRLFEWACLARSSFLWPLSLLIYGTDSEELRRIGGLWMVETGEGLKQVVGHVPVEFQTNSVTDEDARLASWLRQLFGVPGLTGKLQLSVDSPMAEAVVPTAKGPIRIAAATSPIVTGTATLAMTIRMPRAAGPQALSDFVKSDAITPGMALFLQAAVRSRLNLLIVGDTGTGKTTLMRALAAEIPDDEAVIVIEDNPELYLDRPRRNGTPYHRLVIPLGTAIGSWARTTPITMSDLAMHALRHRGSRILLGEARGAEMVDVLSAMTSGTDGSMVTLHARRADEGTFRAALLASFSPMFHGNLKAAEALVHQAVHLAIHLGWVMRADGRHRVVDGVVAYESDGTATNVYSTDDRGMFRRDVATLAALPPRVGGTIATMLSEMPD